MLIHFEMYATTFRIMKKSHFSAYDHKVSLVSFRMRLFSREGQSAGRNQLHAYNVLLLRASARQCEGVRMVFRTFISRRRKSAPGVAPRIVVVVVLLVVLLIIERAFEDCARSREISNS